VKQSGNLKVTSQFVHHKVLTLTRLQHPVSDSDSATFPPCFDKACRLHEDSDVSTAVPGSHFSVSEISRPLWALKQKLLIAKNQQEHKPGCKTNKQKERVNWFRPTFFLLLTEAATKVKWEGPSIIVAEARRTSPMLFKTLSPQVIGQHIIKHKGWNDEAIRKANKCYTPGGHSTRKGVLVHTLHLYSLQV
jgi:hypothetical protein